MTANVIPIKRRKAPEPGPLRRPHVAQHRDEKQYASGHLWRVNRQHVATVLRARAMIGFGEDVR